MAFLKQLMGVDLDLDILGEDIDEYMEAFDKFMEKRTDLDLEKTAQMEEGGFTVVTGPKAVKRKVLAMSSKDKEMLMKSKPRSGRKKKKTSVNPVIIESQ